MAPMRRRRNRHARWPRATDGKQACADEGVDPDTFDPTLPYGFDEARSICDQCPARADCYNLAVERGEWGVWGGRLFVNGQDRTDITRRVIAA